MATSLGTHGDPLRTFLAGWAALEILVNKLFKRYERAFALELTRAHPAVGHTLYLDRVHQVMSDKVRLTDKFAVISAALAPADGHADVATFARLKDLRDKLLHGVLISDRDLPQHEPAQLARKFLELHTGA
jgi:hypothetical protein